MSAGEGAAALHYTYDAAGRLASVTYPDGTAVSYAPGAGSAAPAVSGAAPVEVARPSAAEKRFCMRCGAPAGPDDRFCLQCGAPVD